MADPNFYSLALLAAFNGTNGSTSFVDSGPMAARFSAVGAAQISTAQSKYGGAALSVDGSGSYLTTANAWIGNFGANDFTVEFWLKTTDNNAVVLDHGASAGQWQVFVTSAGKVQWYSNAAILTGAAAVNDGNWHHVAFSRASGTLRLFVDGVADGSVANATSYNDNGAFAIRFAIGAQVISRNALYDLNGYVDDLRITKNVGLYTAGFTPPTALDLTAPAAGQQPAVYVQPSLVPAKVTPPTTGVRKLIPPAVKLKDVIFGGTGRVSGTTKVKGTPDYAVRRKVRLHRERDGLLVYEQWSDATTGAYSFSNVDATEKYTVITYDYLHNFRAVIADNITPDAMP